MGTFSESANRRVWKLSGCMPSVCMQVLTYAKATPLLDPDAVGYPLVEVRHAACICREWYIELRAAAAQHGNRISNLLVGLCIVLSDTAFVMQPLAVRGTLASKHESHRFPQHRSLEGLQPQVFQIFLWAAPQFCRALQVLAPCIFSTADLDLRPRGHVRRRIIGGCGCRRLRYLLPCRLRPPPVRPYLPTMAAPFGPCCCTPSRVIAHHARGTRIGALSSSLEKSSSHEKLPIMAI